MRKFGNPGDIRKCTFDNVTFTARNPPNNVKTTRDVPLALSKTTPRIGTSSYRDGEFVYLEIL